jgi:proline dehydrogenase
MLRKTLLYLSNQPRIFRFVRNNSFAKRFASRFVAGETLPEALAATRTLNAKGLSASLDLLGESVTNEKEAREARDAYIEMLSRIHDERLDANVSVKLTAMGLDISEDLCVAIMQDVLTRAQQVNSFVRLDMESSAYTERTLRLFYDRLYPSFKSSVGIVLQSYLYRSKDDVMKANAARARVRICKGAYKEPPTVAYQERDDVDRSYVECMQELLSHGNYPGVATHDPKIIAATKAYAKANAIDTSRYEFQMLYGVRRDLQEQLVRDGYRMRVYVPFGTQWYPYLMRRLAERPANVAFITGSVMAELAGRGKR